MALSTYSDLTSAIADWLERGDLSARIPDFITLAESRLNRELGIRSLESDAALVGIPGSRFIALPAGFREAQNLWINRDGGQRETLRATMPELTLADITPSEPRSWSIDGPNIAFERPCDQAYSFTLRKVGGLSISESAPTNLVLTNYPDLYLFGSLTEAGGYLRDNELFALFDGRFQVALNAAKDKEGRAKTLTTLSTEPGVLTSYSRRSGYSVFTDQ